MRRRPPRAAPLLVAVLLAAVLAGCGSNTLNAGQLRARATKICRTAERRTARIKTPTEPGEGAAFISRGISVLATQLTALRRLRPPDDLADDYRTAVTATAAELASLRSTLKGLRAGNDPVVALKTLQAQLAPNELKATGAWTALELPACRGD